MARNIDLLPTPTHIKPKKLIVLSAPRTGTHGLYLALKMLGYTPYHMAEVIKAGPYTIQVMNDGLRAEMYHKGERYGRAEFDKWFAEYDVIIEMPFFMLRSVLKAYPDAKFLLTERNPDKWATSIMNTIGKVHKGFHTFPMSIYKYLDGFTSGMSFMGDMTIGYYGNGHGATPEGEKALAENYKEYIAEVKRIVPPEQLKVCRLEDGFGWEEICPYLGVPVPDAKWPSLNTPEEFHQFSSPKIQQVFVKGLIGTASIIAPFVAVCAWYLRRGSLSL